MGVKVEIILLRITLFNLYFINSITGWSLNPISWFIHSKGCELNLNTDLNHGHEPVFLTRTRHGFELAKPQLVDETGMFKMSKGDKLYIACPGNGNEILDFATLGSQSIMSQCVEDKTLQLKGKNVISSKLECKNKVFSTVKEMHIACGNYVGEEIHLGFEVEGWHPLVTLCYYRDRAETLHATHLLYGSVLRGAEIKSRKNYFMKGPRSLYPGFNPANAYKQANQREVLRSLLGETRANYILARSYLSRSHLSPDADFLLGIWQHLTYFYVNIAPMWQSINGGNWLRLETFVRTFASGVQQDFVVTTGTYGVLELEDSNNVPKKIFLDPHQELMPVPLLFWKIIADPRTYACIVFLVHNNPFLKTIPSTVCKNICHNHGWPTDMDSVIRGYTYCCSYTDFKRVVDYAPDLSCRSVLENSYL